jgi:hypothetical protein
MKRNETMVHYFSMNWRDIAREYDIITRTCSASWWTVTVVNYTKKLEVIYLSTPAYFINFQRKRYAVNISINVPMTVGLFQLFGTHIVNSLFLLVLVTIGKCHKHNTWVAIPDICPIDCWWAEGDCWYKLNGARWVLLHPYWPFFLFSFVGKRSKFMTCPFDSDDWTNYPIGKILRYPPFLNVSLY